MSETSRSIFNALRLTLRAQPRSEELQIRTLPISRQSLHAEDGLRMDVFTFGIWKYVLCKKRFLKSSFKSSGGIGQFSLNLISDDCFLPARPQAGFKQNRKELNFAPVAPTSAHTESIFSVVFEIWLMSKL